MACSQMDKLRAFDYNGGEAKNEEAQEIVDNEPLDADTQAELEDISDL